ncbi:MAG TPA: DUF371 domain-containing protein [Candidatus Limnocylindrales bacterium]|nr:DUF371 domain-containing protein [Candidatus Limnocylindrales bacterium]
MSVKQTKEVVLAWGHENIQAVHPSTLMFTKEKHLSKKGDCVIAVAADKAVADLSREFKQELKKPNSKLTITIEADGSTQQINASGSAKLALTNQVDMVIRKSDYISDRTLAICADKSSNDLPRGFIEKLKNPEQGIKITLAVHA